MGPKEGRVYEWGLRTRTCCIFNFSRYEILMCVPNEHNATKRASKLPNFLKWIIPSYFAFFMKLSGANIEHTSSIDYSSKAINSRYVVKHFSDVVAAPSFSFCFFFWPPRTIPRPKAETRCFLLCLLLQRNTQNRMKLQRGMLFVRHRRSLLSSPSLLTLITLESSSS